MRRSLLILCAIAVISSTASIWFFIEREIAIGKYRELERTLGLENSFLKRTLTEVSSERDQFKEKITLVFQEILQVKQEKLDLKAMLNTANQIQEDLEQKIATLEGQSQILQAQVKDQKSRLGYLQSKLIGSSPEQISDRRALGSLKKELEKVKQERASVEQRLAVAEQTIQQLQSHPQMAEGTKAIELPPIIVGQALPLLNPSIPAGKILRVNEEHRFVVIGLGEKDGVKPGMKFKVMRGTEEVGNIEVIEARTNIAAADIKGIHTASLQSDDQVFLSQR